mgnify:CR=1 FL=1
MVTVLKDKYASSRHAHDTVYLECEQAVHVRKDKLCRVFAISPGLEFGDHKGIHARVLELVEVEGFEAVSRINEKLHIISTNKGGASHAPAHPCGL